MLIPVKRVRQGMTFVREGKHYKILDHRIVAGKDAEELLGIHKPVGSFHVFTTCEGNMITTDKGSMEILDEKS